MKSQKARQEFPTQSFPSGPASINAAQSSNAAQSIAGELRDRILTGELKPKTRLTQRDLAAEFGLSSMPARDAIKLLLSEGLAIQEGLKTVVVAPLNPEDFADIMEIRTLLEPRALELSIPQMSKMDLAHCEAMLRLSGTTNHPMTFVENHWSFHRSIYRRAGRPRLLAIIETQHTHLMRYLMPNWALTGVEADWAEGETELMRLVREKRTAEAVSYLRDDLEKTAKRVLKAMAG